MDGGPRAIFIAVTLCDTRRAMKLLNRLRFPFAAALAGLVLSAASPTHAQSSGEDASFRGYLQYLAARARSEGVSESAIQQVISGLTYNPRVVALDRDQAASPSANPPPPPPFAPYRRRHVDSARINGGKTAYARAAGLIPRIEREYGVPGKYLIAIWGHETNYGSYMGDFDLPRSLATLAYDGRRREMFADEFIALLKMVDMGVSRRQLVGSWAGAFGNPQFLPTVWLRVARDGDGNGTRDIWNSTADTLASIANYFRDAGWRPGEPWGVQVGVPARFDRRALATNLVSPVCPRVHERHSPWRTVREWRAMGLVPYGTIGEDTLAFLFEPDGPGETAYLLTGNYKVILEYNCSNYYALSVGLLADEIAR
jgi:membrane-bound lytic murein transglycosylase B